MKLAELLTEYEHRLLWAERHGATAPLNKTYEIVLDELRELDGTPSADRMMTTAEAGHVLSVSAKTVAKWAADGQLDGAWRTSDGNAGEWRVPARSVYARAAGRSGKGGTRAVPRLWTEDTQ